MFITLDLIYEPIKRFRVYVISAANICFILHLLAILTVSINIWRICFSDLEHCVKWPIDGFMIKDLGFIAVDYFFTHRWFCGLCDTQVPLLRSWIGSINGATENSAYLHCSPSCISKYTCGILWRTNQKRFSYEAKSKIRFTLRVVFANRSATWNVCDIS